MNRITPFLFLFIIVLICFSSCGLIVKNKARKKFNVENGCIPPDFGKNKYEILLVPTHRFQKMNAVLKQCFGNIYGGKFDIMKVNQDFKRRASNNEVKLMHDKKFKGPIKLPKYIFLNDRYIADTTRYRYVFDCKTVFVETLNSAVPSGRMPWFTCYIYDRLIDKHYVSTFSSTKFPSLLKGYIFNLEMVRLENLMKYN